MPFVLPAFLFNIWFRRAMLALVLVAAYFYWQHRQRQIGRQEGAAVESQANATVQAQNVQSNRTVTVEDLATISMKMTVLEKQLEAQNNLILIVAQQRQQKASEVQGMSPAEVDARINQVLGKPQGSTTFTEDDRRRFLGCLEDLPLCNQQVKEQAVKIDTQKDEIVLAKQKFDRLAIYTTSLEQTYTALWNDKAQAKRSGKCLWLWKCSRPQLKVPDPKLLLQRPN